MSKRLFIPLRYKILIALLLGISIIVGVITFTMAKLFHTDKTAYINDLVLTNTIHTAQETNTLLLNYQERVRSIARVAYDKDIDQDQKVLLFDDFFNSFPEIVAVTFYEDGQERTTVFDELALTEAGITKADLDAHRINDPVFYSDPGEEGISIRNTTFDEDLPVMTLVTKARLPDMDVDLTLSAVINIDRILSIVKRSELYDAFILEPDGSHLAHKDLQRVFTHSPAEYRPDNRTLPERSSLAATFEYVIDGIDMIGGFTRVETGDLIVGTQIPTTAAYLTARDLFDDLLLTAFLILLAATGSSYLWSYRITRPLEKLSSATREVGRGVFDINLRATSRDEIGGLTESVNEMARELKEREKALGEAQGALIQSEKMSAFGQLSAGIAHEVKNPLAGIMGYAQMSLKKMEDDSPIYKNIKIIEQETRRCNSIIENLMKFARQDEPDMKPLEVNDVIEDALTLVDHQMGISQITLEKDLADDLPGVRGDSNQLIQVLMNILINAKQAMEGEPGNITVQSRSPNAGVVEIRITDTGPGMPEEVSSKIFEPFFTTKEAGKGTGLGLAVTYGIVKDHGGNIRVESKTGEGATFIITLPVTSTAAGDAEEIVSSETNGNPEPDEPGDATDGSTGAVDE